MRNYWLKVAFGALAVFLVGMVAVSAVRRGGASVKDIVQGNGPISIPLPAMVPFNLDGTRLGSIRRLTIYRSDSKTPSGVTLTVQLPDSIASERLGHCILLADSLENIDEHTSFRCGTVSDTAGKDLRRFGSVLLRGRSDSFPLLLPERTIRDFTNHTSSRSRRATVDASDAADSVEQQADALADSIETAATDEANRLAGAGERMRASHVERADSIRSAAKHQADSIRTAASSH